MIKCGWGGKLLPAFVFTLFYSYLLPQRGHQGERRAKSTTLPSCLWQATVSRGRDRALVAAKPAGPPLRSSRLDRSACVSSSHASASHLRGSPISARTMGHSQARKWQKAHRGFAKKALSRPLHRGGQHCRAPKKDFAKQKIFWESKRFFGKRRRRREKRSGCRKAIARICALRRRGDSFRLLRRQLPLI